MACVLVIVTPCQGLGFIACTHEGFQTSCESIVSDWFQRVEPEHWLLLKVLRDSGNKCYSY